MKSINFTTNSTKIKQYSTKIKQSLNTKKKLNFKWKVQTLLLNSTKIIEFWERASEEQRHELANKMSNNEFDHEDYDEESYEDFEIDENFDVFKIIDDMPNDVKLAREYLRNHLKNLNKNESLNFLMILISGYDEVYDDEAQRYVRLVTRPLIQEIRRSM